MADRVALGALAAYGVGTSTVVWQSAPLISIGVGGVVADAYGIAAVYWAGGALLLLAGGVGLAAGRNTEVT